MSAKPSKKVIALGFFDGVHRGHAQLINLAMRRAEEIGAEPAVLSFDTSPMAVVTGKPVPLIGNTKTREDMVRRLFSIETVIIYHFDKAIMTMPWSDFIDSLVGKFSAVHFIIGHDFHCGYKGEGNPQRIYDYCAEKGIGCDIVPEFRIDDIVVSSTYIRTLIAEGNIIRANEFLGHPYCVSGEVLGGRRVGRKLGTPTINLKFDADMALPARGVYATKVVLGDKELPAVTNVGVRPTFGDNSELTVESYILDFDGDLYGQFVRVDFYDFIRPERRFDNPAELSEQICSDAETARRILTEVNK